ncbi:ferredoxin [Pseudaestuariivita sp.]|uniref:ferredoxin n=1 Tax=Pseudaestuariivita sp. TaxID=2211669 RepID=UPI004059A42B
MEPVAALRQTIERAAAPHGLIWMGGVQEDGQTLVLLGTGQGFWPVFTRGAEYNDGMPDPLDRWSTRVLGKVGQETGARDVAFPFGGPPYAPFLRWASATGEAWQSPVGMLVHAEAGLMISYRGALVFDGAHTLPETPASPCEPCAAPCADACPVDALSARDGYDVAACHAFLDTDAGQDCLSRGCKARRACPVSQGFGRDPAQSAFHMAAFHPT